MSFNLCLVSDTDDGDTISVLLVEVRGKKGVFVRHTLGETPTHSP